MIKKLNRTLRHEIDNGFTISEPVSIGEMQEKINELVDAVNGILDYAPLEMATKAEPEPADPYAEQRKWIGKLCRFWDDGTQEISYGVFTKIDDRTFSVAKYCCEDVYYHDHCEPVKPDDDIIYRGE